MPRPEQTTEIEAEVIGATEKALRLDTGNGRYWVPKSVISNIEEVPEHVGGRGAFRIQSWFVEKEEID